MITGPRSHGKGLIMPTLTKTKTSKKLHAAAAKAAPRMNGKASGNGRASASAKAGPAKGKAVKRVYFFGNGKAEGNANMKDLLGGKGANLADMTLVPLPVPPGFTITTDTCGDYNDAGQKLPAGLMDEVRANVAKIEKATGKRFGDASNPLLVAARSGAKMSMPGMMDTVLNIGMNDQVVTGLAQLTGNERFAYDSYRRLINMFGDTVMGVDHEHFEHELSAVKNARGRQARYGSGYGRPEGSRRAIQEGLQPACGIGVPARSVHAARACDRSRLQKLDGRPRDPLSRAERDPRPSRHRRQCAVDGLRQHGRRQRDRRGLHPQSLDRREQVLWRVPDQRPGRRRGGRHPHANPLRADGRVEQEELEGTAGGQERP